MSVADEAFANPPSVKTTTLLERLNVPCDALADTVRREAAYRFAPKAGKGYPWSEVALYPLAVLAAHLPVSAFAALTFRKRFWESSGARARLLAQLLHCWTWPNLLFWTLVPNHNVRYALPMSAGLMGLGVMGLLSLISREPKAGAAARKLVSGGAAFLCCWCVAKVVFVEVVIPTRTAGRNAEATAAALRERVRASRRSRRGRSSRCEAPKGRSASHLRAPLRARSSTSSPSSSTRSASRGCSRTSK